MVKNHFSIAIGSFLAPIMNSKMDTTFGQGKGEIWSMFLAMMFFVLFIASVVHSSIKLQGYKNGTIGLD